MSKASELLDRLSQVEAGCDKHTFHITIKINQKITEKLNYKIIGGCLRVLAQDTDGLCAFKNVTDRKLISDTGAVFSFTSEENRALFKKRCRLYLSTSVYAGLWFSI